MTYTTIQPAELKGLLESADKPVLLDVRQPEEVGVATIQGALHIPMGEMMSRVQDLDPSATTVVFCHHGIRSQHVMLMLRQKGFRDVRNLVGGIDTWSQIVDPSVPRYEFDGRRIRAYPAAGS
jgi:adenylyltransferase/sulfurtransferase